MRTIYVAREYENDSILFATEDKNLAEEYMHDSYVEDLYHETMWNMNYCNQPFVDAYSDARAGIENFYANWTGIEEVDFY